MGQAQGKGVAENILKPWKFSDLLILKGVTQRPVNMLYCTSIARIVSLI